MKRETLVRINRQAGEAGRSRSDTAKIAWWGFDTATIRFGTF
jgi:hypothetical protein